MSHRYGQEEKFKNITLRIDDIPQMHASTIVRASPAEREHYRPSTPISSSKFHDTNLNIQIRTTQLPAHNRGYSINQSPNATSHLRRQEDDEEEGLRRQLQQKKEIISQLKNIIKLSNENYSRVKPKSVYLGDRSPQRHDDELKQLRHNVKVLTIENNALSGYIDKLKQQLAEVGLTSNREGGSFEKQREELSTIQQLKDQNKRLRQLVEEKQAMYQSKIDQFILSHKSLANQCKRLQHMKQAAEAENERLSLMLRDLEETQRRTHHQEDKFGKTMSGEKASIIKIKEQYAQSIRQMRQTIHIQFENMFDNFRITLAEIDKKVKFLQRRMHRIEEQLRNVGSQIPLHSTRKSEIYIEQGSELASEGSARKNNFRSVMASRLFEEVQRSDEDTVRPLHQEINRLKEIIADLEQQMSSRSDYYTFRDQEASDMPTEREKELSHEVDKLKQEIDRLEEAYQREKSAMQDKLQEEIAQRQQKTSELHELHQKYEYCLEQMKNLVASKRLNQELSKEMSILRKQNAEVLRKVDQYKRLCLLLQQQTEQNSVSFQLFTDMKRQIIEIKEIMHLEHVKLTATDKQNKEILAANQQLKLKIEQSFINIAKLTEQHQQLKQLYKQSQAEKEEVTLRANYNEKVIIILQDELRAKKEIESILIAQKNSLQKQVIGYLSLFNKLTFQQGKSRRQEYDELPIETLLNKLSRLQTSFNEFHSSKREIISKMMNESFDAQLSSVKRKDRI